MGLVKDELHLVLYIDEVDGLADKTVVDFSGVSRTALQSLLSSGAAGDTGSTRLIHLGNGNQKSTASVEPARTNHGRYDGGCGWLGKS